MTGRLYREFVLSGPAVWQLVKELVREHAKACIDRGAPLRVIFTTEERRRTPEQNARYWSGAVLGAIAEQVFVEGRQFTEEVWHEELAQRFCPRIEVTLPSGEIFTRRKSTSEMSVKEFAEYVQKVEAYAASELLVEFGNGF